MGLIGQFSLILIKVLRRGIKAIDKEKMSHGRFTTSSYRKKSKNTFKERQRVSFFFYLEFWHFKNKVKF